MKSSFDFSRKKDEEVDARAVCDLSGDEEEAECSTQRISHGRRQRQEPVTRSLMNSCCATSVIRCNQQCSRQHSDAHISPSAPIIASCLLSSPSHRNTMTRTSRLSERCEKSESPSHGDDEGGGFDLVRRGGRAAFESAKSDTAPVPPGAPLGSRPTPLQGGMPRSRRAGTKHRGDLGSLLLACLLCAPCNWFHRVASPLTLACLSRVV